MVVNFKGSEIYRIKMVIAELLRFILIHDRGEFGLRSHLRAILKSFNNL